MNKFKKCFSALFLSCFLAFGNVSGCYLEVKAFDYVAPSLYLPFDGAIPYLMGLLGVASSDDYLFSEEDYKEYLLKNGFTEEDLNNENGSYRAWVQDISNGALNQSSEYWTKFKTWVKSKFSTGSVSGNITLDTLLSGTPYNFQNYSYNGDYQGQTLPNSFDTSKIFCIANGSSSGSSNFSIYFGFDNITFSSITNGIRIDMDYSSSSGHVYFLSGYSSSSSYGWSAVNTTNKHLSLDINLSNRYYTHYIYPLNFSVSSDWLVYPWQITTENITNLVVNPDIIDKLSFALSDAISTAIPDVIPLPWEQIGDTADEVTDSLDALIEKVNSGVISISDYMQAVLDLVGVIAVDTSTDLVYPQNPDKPDESIDDKVNENKDNGVFVLSGFEKVFPFCIPFDVYAFMTLLVADPVAPVIRYPIYNPVTKENNEIILDFSKWESVTVLFRYIFDFLFIIGLLLSARALIGGGDKA